MFLFSLESRGNLRPTRATGSDRHSRHLLAAVVVGALSAWGNVQSAPAGDADAAVRESVKAYEEAFNKGDAKAVASMWTPAGSMVDESGQVHKGREAIEKAYAELFKANPGGRVEVEITALEFPADNVAIEEGVARTPSATGGPAAVGRYTAVHAKQDGKWLMATVRELADETDVGLKALTDLDWLVGKWSVERDRVRVEQKFSWVEGGKFLRRDYNVTEDGKTTASGMQMIGWDPLAAKVRSWSFDASGGHSYGLWEPTAEGWRVDCVGMLADGTPVSSTDFLISVKGDPGVLGWRSTDRMAGGIGLPDLPEVVLDREKESR